MTSMFWKHTKPSMEGPPVSLEVWSRGCTTPPSVRDDLLLARVAETVTWCESLSESEGYRTKALGPSLFHDGLDDLVCGLGNARQSELRYKKLAVPSGVPVLAPGRFMLYFPDENLSDGYAKLVSRGFFDAENVPAHDTWVSLFNEEDRPQRSSRRYLLCYVPVAAVEAANAGIEGNPEECIVWLDGSDVAIRHRIKQIVRRQ